MRIARVGAKAVIVAYMIVTNVIAPQKIKNFYSPNSPLYGIYDVDEFAPNGELLPPLATDATRWRKVVFLTTDETYVEQMDDSWNDLDTSYDNAAKKVTLVFKSGKTTNKSAFAYPQPDRDHMVLNGSLGNDSITVKLKRFDESKFDLVKSKFRWINGFP